jgi:hypothetical protein
VTTESPMTALCQESCGSGSRMSGPVPIPNPQPRECSVTSVVSVRASIAVSPEPGLRRLVTMFGVLRTALHNQTIEAKALAGPEQKRASHGGHGDHGD